MKIIEVIRLEIRKRAVFFIQDSNLMFILFRFAFKKATQWVAFNRL
jgi:hypothetical protein